MSNAQVSSIKFAVAKVEEYKEVKTNSGYIAWGKDNAYPQMLVRLFNDSAKHGAIVTGKSSYIIGRGFKADNQDVEAKMMYASSGVKMDLFLKKLATDYELFGSYAYLVIPRTDGKGASSFMHIDMSKVRTNDLASMFWVYPEWEMIGNGKPKEGKGLKTYEAFDGEYDKPKVVYYTAYRPAGGVYGQPEYKQGLTAIETDCRVNNFHLNNLRNGFFGSKIISVNVVDPSPDAQDAYSDLIKKNFTSDENAGQFVLLFNNGTERAIQIEDLTAGNFGEQFAQLRKDTEQEIFIAHKIPSPMLFGVRVEGQLGGRTELIEAFELFNNTYIHERRLHFQELLKDLASMKGYEAEFEILPFTPIKSQFSEATLLQILTKDEMREMLDMEPLPDGTGSKLGNEQPEPQQPAQFDFSAQTDDEDVQVFLKYGTPKQGKKVVSHFSARYRSLIEMESFHQSFADLSKSEGVNENEKKILKQIDSGKQPKFSKEQLDELRKKKLIEVDRQSGSLRLTQLGGLVLTDIQTEREIAQLRTVYEYVKRPDASGPDILPNGRTRPFCEALISADKFFSREDINNISAELGYDVWAFRGGWFTLPNGNHRPSCRHIWRAVLIED